MINLTEERIRILLISAYTLEALETGGVDNWEWFGESISDYITNYNKIFNTNFESIDEIVDSEIETNNLTI